MTVTGHINSTTEPAFVVLDLIERRKQAVPGRRQDDGLSLISLALGAAALLIIGVAIGTSL